MRAERFVALLLLAALVAGATAAHRHTILEDLGPAASAPQALSDRCALETALSLHAIPRIVERNGCWACHWHRLFRIFAAPAIPEPVPPGRALALPPPRAAANIARFTRLSRGPPVLS